MEMNRFGRLIRARWPIVLLIGLVGLGAAVLVTSLVNQRLERRFEAMAPLALFGPPEQGEKGDSLAGAASVARTANLEAISGGTVQVEADPDTGRLLFSATGPSAEAAVEGAEEARRRYLAAAEPLAQEEIIEARLEALAVEIAEVGERLEALAPPEPADDEGVEERVLDTQISSLADRAGALVVELALAEVRGAPPEEVLAKQQELEAIESALAELEEQRREVAEEESDALSEEDLRRRALQRYQESLMAEYETLYVRRIRPDPNSIAGPVEVSDITPDLLPYERSALLGLLAGLLLALVVVVLHDRARRPVWTTAQLAGYFSSAEEMPPRRAGRSPRPWYPMARAGPRKSGIQALRATVEGVVGESSAAVGVFGVGVGSEQVHALAADLAASLATARREILLVDADVERPSELPEFAGSGPPLAEVVVSSLFDEEEARRFVRHSMGAESVVLPRLRAIRAGTELRDAADALAGPQFALFLAEAKRMMEVVVVAGLEADHPATDALLQRLDYAVLVARAGRATEGMLEVLVRELAGRKAEMLCIVLLHGRAERVRRLRRRGVGSAERHRVPEPGTGRPGRERLPKGREEPARSRRRRKSQASDQAKLF